MNENPLVSVIVPTLNSSKFIEACLVSIKNQDYFNIELIVVDNHSTDDTVHIAKKYADKVCVFGPERSAQRNLGVRQSKGDFVLIVDSDMELTSKVVSACVNVITQDSELKGVVIPEQSFGSGLWARCKALEKSFYQGVGWIEAARFYPKQIFIDAGGFDEDLISGEDWDLSQRIESLGKVGRVDEMILHNEGHPRLAAIVKKKLYYAKEFSKYTDKNQSSPSKKKQTGILRRYWLFISHPVKLFKNPIVGVAMLFMKTCEFAFGSIGYLSHRFKNRYVITGTNKEIIKKTHYRIRKMFKHPFKNKKHILFYPDFPYKRSKMHRICLNNAIKITSNIRKKHDLVVRWQDTTFKTVDDSLRQLISNNKVLNGSCLDISKERVDRIFTQVFGYSSLIDPLSYQGECLRKSNVNGAHDGKVVIGPIVQKEKGFIYQRLMKNKNEADLFEEFRVFIINFDFSVISNRQRSATGRFDGDGEVTKMLPTAEVFDEVERKNIIKFCKEFGLEFGELDIIKDNEEGRIYIVDANDTPYLIRDIKKNLESQRILKHISTDFINAYLKIEA